LPEAPFQSVPTLTTPMPEPPRATPRWLAAAGLALALHVGVFAALVWVMPPPETPAVMVEGLEVTPMPEPAAEQPEETPEPPAEPMQAAEPPPPEQVAAAPPPDAAPPPPPETVQAERPPEPQPPPPPEPLAAMEPEPQPTEPPPPEMVESAEPEPVVAEAPPPPPPPPPPQPRPHPAPPSPPVAAAPSPTPAPPQAAAPARPAGPPPSYIGALLAALNRHKQYPAASRLRREEGVVMLRFAMRRDGTVMRWRVERSSGHPELDEAVGVMVNAASPLPAPPPELAGDPVELVVPVRFSLR
jgi:periplasmic protein TonB